MFITCGRCQISFQWLLNHFSWILFSKVTIFFFFLFKVSFLMLLLNDSWKLWTRNGIANKTTAVNVHVGKGFQWEKLNYLENTTTHTPGNNPPVQAHCVYRPLADWKAARTQRRPETDWSRQNWVVGEFVGGRWWWVLLRLLEPPLPLHDAQWVVLMSRERWWCS